MKSSFKKFFDFESKVDGKSVSDIKKEQNTVKTIGEIMDEKEGKQIPKKRLSNKLTGREKILIVMVIFFFIAYCGASSQRDTYREQLKTLTQEKAELESKVTNLEEENDELQSKAVETESTEKVTDKIDISNMSVYASFYNGSEIYGGHVHKDYDCLFCKKESLGSKLDVQEVDINELNQIEKYKSIRFCSMCFPEPYCGNSITGVVNN
ncbi:hypothetical protein [Terrisporobacter glycolicus]|uniref:Uncharacterized protein n=1 Tax=Terrisporobacter glycolicus ATCC 14880 = DSM 1288 TaxID=1121315 RepID=A0ABZ2EX71_9FIRM|nr:hypothetical protein [Terrisporobacter glycolicus]